MFSRLAKLSSLAAPLSVAVALLLSAPVAGADLSAAGAAASGADAATQPAAGRGAWPWPLLGELITAYKNGNDPYAAGQHRGIDIAAPVGAPVRAVVGGRVSFAGRLPDGGLAVTLASADGDWLISSLHLSALGVARGERVGAGALLGRVGTSGRRSASVPHLHLSVRRTASRAYVDPMALLGAPRVADAPNATSVPSAASVPSTAADEAALEASTRAAKSVRAQTTGDSSPAKQDHLSGRGHHAGKPRGHTRSVGASAHEGHAAEGYSRVAPPPMPRLARPPVATARVGRASSTATSTTQVAPQAQAAESVRTARRRNDSRRALLLAIAALCIAALVLRRKPEETPSAGGGDATSVATADVVDLDSRRRSA